MKMTNIVRFATVVFILCAAILKLPAREMGSWKTFFEYNNVTEVVQAKDKIFAISNGALFSVDTEYESIETYTKVNGLSDGTISHLAYSPDYDALILVYENSNIDILRGYEVTNISDLKRKEISGKNVNSITMHGRYAYLSCGLGIVVVDIAKNEIADTYIIGSYGSYLNVYKTEIVGDYIYAQSQSTIKKANINDANLADFKKWNTIWSLPSEAKTIENFNDHLIVVTADSIYYCESDSDCHPFLPADDFEFVNVSQGRLLIRCGMYLYNFTTSLENPEYLYIDYCKYAVYDAKSRKYWVSHAKDYVDYVNGVYDLYVYQNNVQLNHFVPDGPQKTAVAFLKYSNGMLITGSGGRFDIPVQDYPGYVQIYENDKWTVIKESDFDPNIFVKLYLKGPSWTYADDSIVGSGKYTIQTQRFVDVMDAIVDPTDPKRIYVATWRSLFEIYDKKPVMQYWINNSALSQYYINIMTDGLCYDNDNNLWMANMLTTNAVVVKKNDGSWDSFYYPSLEKKEVIKETFFSKNGYLWMVCSRLASGAGIFVVDQNGTPFNSNDDRSKYYASFVDEDGNTITPAFRCITEDKNNTIWIGTTVGPLIINNAKNIFDDDFRIGRIKITREDNDAYADYLLGSDQINAIVVDGGNRKWVASSTSGLYLLSEDGKETIRHFTTENSPLTSNSIIDLAMNHETGELFVATSSGLFSYMTDATEGNKDYEDVYVYPNPVTPDFDGEITINGLVENSIVRIADAEGAVVYENYSNGGTFAWDGRSLSGRRVATGVYFIFAAQEDGSMKMVSKLAFIH